MNRCPKKSQDGYAASQGLRLRAFLYPSSSPFASRAGRHLKLIREMTGVAVLAAQREQAGAKASCPGFFFQRSPSVPRLSMKDSAEASEAQGEAHGR